MQRRLGNALPQYGSAMVGGLTPRAIARAAEEAPERWRTRSAEDERAHVKRSHRAAVLRMGWLYWNQRNTYFLQALGVSEARRAADPVTQPTTGFKAIMREAADTRSYAAALSVLVVAEWLYLDWASRAPLPLPNNFVHAEWITLHDNSNFRGFVDFLRTELDRVGPAHADLCRDFFSRAVALELSFFEAAYTT